MVKTVVGNTDLSLSAKSTESLRILDVRVYNPVSSYVTIKTGMATRGYFRVGGVLGNHLPFPMGRSEHSHDFVISDEQAAETLKTYQVDDAGGGDSTLNYNTVTGAAGTFRRIMQLSNKSTKGLKTILAWLMEQGFWNGYPVAPDETFTITGAKQSGAIQQVIYEIGEPGDFPNTLPNGSKADEYLFVNYGNSGGNINIDGYTELTTPANPAEFPNFPFGQAVVSKVEMDILGILASDFAPLENNGTNYITTDYIKLIRDLTTLFDEDEQGLLLYGLMNTNEGSMDAVGEGISQIGNYSDVDQREPWMHPEGMTFTEGEELKVMYGTSKTLTGQNIDVYEQEVGAICRVRKIA